MPALIIFLFSMPPRYHFFSRVSCCYDALRYFICYIIYAITLILFLYLPMMLIYFDIYAACLLRQLDILLLTFLCRYLFIIATFPI